MSAPPSHLFRVPGHRRRDVTRQVGSSDKISGSGYVGGGDSDVRVNYGSAPTGLT